MFTKVKPKWFKGYTTAEEVKRRYRDLCKMYHPDLHPGETSENIMKEVNAEYDCIWEQVKNIHDTTSSEEGYTEHKTSDDFDFKDEPEEVKEIINKLMFCEGLIVNIVGSWVWVTGNTFLYKETLKDLGLKWASGKKAWYWKPEGAVVRPRRKMSLDEIKDKYGCESFATKVTPKLS